MVLVKACCSTLTAFSHGEVPVWLKAGAARIERPWRSSESKTKHRRAKRLQREMFTSMPQRKVGSQPCKAAKGSSWRLQASGRALRAMRESAVHATWPDHCRGTVGALAHKQRCPRSRSPLPQAFAMQSGGPGNPVSRARGVRGENSLTILRGLQKGKLNLKKCRMTTSNAGCD